MARSINQSAISFKIDNDNLQNVDNICKLFDLKRNKFINYCLRFGLETVLLQIDCCHRKDDLKKHINFIKDLL